MMMLFLPMKVHLISHAPFSNIIIEPALLMVEWMDGWMNEWLDGWIDCSSLMYTKRQDHTNEVNDDQHSSNLELVD